jgi:charged multivesicular body protein 7
MPLADIHVLAKAELTTDRTIIPVSKFLSAPHSIYDSGSTAYWLAATLVGKPLWWALQQTGIVGSGETIETESQRWRRLASDYVVVPLLEHAAERVLEHQEALDSGSAADAVYSWSAFKKTFGAVALDRGLASDEDIKVLVKFLERDRKVIITDKNVSTHAESANFFH